MILVNTDYITGKELEMLGLVRGSTIQSKNIGRDITQRFTTLVGGELKYHALTDSTDYGICLFSAGHFFTENPVCAKLFELTVSADADIMPTISFSNRIRTV